MTNTHPQLHALTEQLCQRCSKPFTPKPGGYTAKYCGKRCRELTKMAAKPPYDPAKRRTYWKRTKADPDLIARARASGRKSVSVPRQWLAEYKLERGCIDCGFKLHFAALQLDHTGPKAGHIAELRSSIGRLQAEIQGGRCRVRCANCHAIKTWADKNGIDYQQWRIEHVGNQIPA